MSPIEQLAIEAALRKMFTDSHFNICTIDSIIKLTGTLAPKRAYDTLHLLHCVHYRDMAPPVLELLPQLIREVIGGPEIDIESLVKRTAPAAPRADIIDITPELPAKRGLLRFLK